MSRATASANGRTAGWQPETDSTPPIRKHSLRNLLEQFPDLQPPVIDGLLREGETCNVIAASKVGKSWFVYYVALCVGAGWRLFDRFDTTAGKVLLIDNELHPETLSHRIPVVAEAMGVDPFGDNAAHLDDLEVWTLRGDLRTISELSREFDNIEAGEYKLLVLDAKYRLLADGASENDNASEARFYNQVDRIAAKTGAAVMLVHHSSKGSQSDKSVTDVGAGAGAQSRAADCHLVLREHEEPGHVVLDAAVRSFKPVSPLVLRWKYPLWVPVEGADPSKLKGTKTKQQESQAIQDAEADKAIVGALLGQRMTTRKLREETGMSKGRIERRLDSLVAAGHAAYEMTTVSNNRCKEYFLVNDPAKSGGR